MDPGLIGLVGRQEKIAKIVREPAKATIRIEYRLEHELGLGRRTPHRALLC